MLRLLALAALVLPATLNARTLGAGNFQTRGAMAAPATPPAFADEFDGAGINSAKWRYDTAFNKAGWFNHEKQYYSADRAENARVEQGSLVIEARREKLDSKRFPDWGGQAYTSAKLIARQRLGYGFYEVRAQLPCARGTWPAIWLLAPDGKWPDEGEIDVMEMVGWDANVVHATIHSGAYNHVKGTQRGAETRVATACTAYHTYQLDWQPNAITIGIDGQAYMKVTDPGEGKPGWPFTRAYDLILNLAVGGDWGGAKGIDDKALPQQMRIDYVRYWAR